MSEKNNPSINLDQRGTDNNDQLGTYHGKLNEIARQSHEQRQSYRDNGFHCMKSLPIKFCV